MPLPETHEMDPNLLPDRVNRLMQELTHNNVQAGVGSPVDIMDSFTYIMRLVQNEGSDSISYVLMPLFARGEIKVLVDAVDLWLAGDHEVVDVFLANDDPDDAVSAVKEYVS